MARLLLTLIAASSDAVGATALAIPSFKIQG
jgi:hypothetical protein